MIRRSRLLSRLLFLAGALLLAKGSFSVYPFLFPSSPSAEVSVVEALRRAAPASNPASLSLICPCLARTLGSPLLKEQRMPPFEKARATWKEARCPVPRQLRHCRPSRHTLPSIEGCPDRR